MTYVLISRLGPLMVVAGGVPMSYVTCQFEERLISHCRVLKINITVTPSHVPCPILKTHVAKTPKRPMLPCLFYGSTANIFTHPPLLDIYLNLIYDIMFTAIMFYILCS